ncbi:hypothetical protein GTP58_18535 [Duganella sp. CY15W]|uniref:hypothetical protein n=1 Tax=Duganella sp. CY15W TaxID=2692172 RepID=UPI001367C505|nr:hypothetical protein [Duganella sp. CY15W]MYM30333.1 hypothetical protein [Duganella sp. CY15W]
MAIMENHLSSALGSFGLHSPYDMLKKAWREYERCTKSDNDDDRRDAAINGAITLWHMNDWVWNGITDYGRKKDEVRALLGVTGPRAEKDDLVKWAVGRCPELAICQSICNGSKHVVCIGIKEANLVSSNPNSPNVKTTPGRLEIVDGSGNTLDAPDVLRKAFDFWYHHATNANVLK